MSKGSKIDRRGKFDPSIDEITNTTEGDTSFNSHVGCSCRGSGKRS